MEKIRYYSDAVFAMLNESLSCTTLDTYYDLMCETMSRRAVILWRGLMLLCEKVVTAEDKGLARNFYDALSSLLVLAVNGCAGWDVDMVQDILYAVEEHIDTL